MDKVDLMFADDARNKLREGINLVNSVVSVTLGPKGRNVLYRNDNNEIISSKDGVSCAKAITSVECPYVSMGIELCKNVSIKANDTAGDGSTTSVILMNALINESLRFVASGGNPLSIQKGMQVGLDVLLDLLSQSSKEISSKAEIESVATISGNSEEVGKTIADVVEKVGSDGIITLEQGVDRETYYEIVDGFTYTNGYINPYFITDASKNIVEYKDVIILMFSGEITTFESLLKTLEKIGKGKPVLIIAENFKEDAISGLVINKVRGGFSWVATKTPGFGAQKQELIKDICATVGGIVFDDKLGHKYDQIDESFFGYAKKIIITKDTTILLQGKRNEQATSDRVELLQSLLESEESEYNKEKLQERIAKLSDGVAIIKIGSSSQLEFIEKRFRFEDSLNATRCAIQHGGIVLGGGSALLKISTILEENVEIDPRDMDQLTGLRILAKAIQAPFRQICDNSGFSADVFARQVIDADLQVGLDAKTGDICNLFERGVIDPVFVTKTAIINAVSLASLTLTTQVIVSKVPDTTEKFLMADPNY